MSETLITAEHQSDSDKQRELGDEDFLLPEEEITISNPDAASERVEPTDELPGQFAEEMERQGFSVNVLEGEDNPFPDILHSLTLVNHDQLPDEPTVRLYRGINPKNGSQIAHQVGYLLKRPLYDEAEFGDKPDVELEGSEVFRLVDAFSDNPSYRLLMDAVSATQMSDNDRLFVDRRIKKLRRNYVKYPEPTFLEELSREHIQAPGSGPSQDLSPFVATSTLPDYAAGWGRTLMVIDVPVSRVAGLGEGKATGDEVLITGEVKPEWISAVAEVKQGEKPTADMFMPFVKALGQEELADASDLADTELHKKSEQNRQSDLQEVNHDLIDEILAIPNIDAKSLGELYKSNAIETYKQALWAAAEYYLKQIESTGRQQFNQGVRELYQYDDVTNFQANKPEMTQVNQEDEFDLVIDDSPAEPNELNIKELEKMVKIYNRLSN